MRRRPRRHAVQMDLFHRQPALPLWQALPPEVKQQVHALVVQLLKEIRLKRRVRQGTKGVADE